MIVVRTLAENASARAADRSASSPRSTAIASTSSVGRARSGEVQRLGVEVGEDGSRATPERRDGGRRKGDGRDNDLVALAQPRFDPGIERADPVDQPRADQPAGAGAEQAFGGMIYLGNHAIFIDQQDREDR
jgi:hypothetical protein